MKSSGVTLGGERIRYMNDNTGIKDKFGVPIFVGDIVRTFEESSEINYKVIILDGRYIGKLIFSRNRDTPVYIGITNELQVIHIRRG